MRVLFEDILKRLKALTDATDEPLLRYINWDYGQQRRNYRKHLRTWTLTER